MKPDQRRRLGRVTLSLLAGGVGLWAAARDVDPGELAHHISAAPVFHLLLAILVLTAGIWVRAERWYVLLGRPSKTGKLPLFWALMVGYLGSTVLPLRMGEALRLYAANREGVSLSQGVLSVSVEHVADLAVIVGVALFILPHLPPDSPLVTAIRIGALITVIGAAVLITALGAIHLAGRQVRERPAGPDAGIMWDLIWRWVSWFSAIVRQLYSARTLFLFLVWSLIVWVFSGAYYLLILKAFSIHPILPAVASILVFGNLAIAVPASPGSIGVYEYLSVAALKTVGVDAASALAFVLVSHAIILGCSILGGTLALWWTGQRWVSLREDAEAVVGSEP